MGFDFTVVAPLLPSRCSVSSVLRHGVCFLAGSNALLSMAVQPLLVILVFSQERMSARPSAVILDVFTGTDICQNVSYYTF